MMESTRETVSTATQLSCPRTVMKIRAPGFKGDGTLQISDMHFKITLTSDHVAKYGWIPFGELRD